jgi:hypothetical protein
VTTKLEAGTARSSDTDDAPQYTRPRSTKNLTNPLVRGRIT